MSYSTYLKLTLLKMTSRTHQLHAIIIVVPWHSNTLILEEREKQFFLHQFQAVKMCPGGFLKIYVFKHTVIMTPRNFLVLKAKENIKNN